MIARPFVRDPDEPDDTGEGEEGIDVPVGPPPDVGSVVVHAETIGADRVEVSRSAKLYTPPRGKTVAHLIVHVNGQHVMRGAYQDPERFREDLTTVSELVLTGFPNVRPAWT